VSNEDNGTDVARRTYEDVPPLSINGQIHHFINWKRAKGHTALLYEAGYLLLGLVSLATVTGLYFWLDVPLVPAAFTYLVILVLLSLVSNFTSLVVLSLIGVCCLSYFFAPPIYSFRVDYPQDLTTISAFVIASVIVIFLVTRVRVEQRDHMRTSETLREANQRLEVTNEALRIHNVERNRTEQALRESEDKLRQIFETVPGLTWSTGSDGSEDTKPEVQPGFMAQLQAILNVLPAYTWYAAPRGALTFVNKRTAEYLGVAKDHPLRFGIDVGAEWDHSFALLHPDDREDARKYWSSRLRTGEGGEHSYRVRSAQGDYRWFLTRMEPLRASDGTLVLWIGATLDIEELKCTEQALREREAQLAEARRELRQMIDTIPIPVASYSADAKRDFVNAAWKQYTGLSEEAALGSEWSLVAHSDHIATGDKIWRDALATGEPSHTEERVRRADGQYRWFAIDRVAARDENGKIIKWYGTAYDIEDRKVAEEALREREAKIRRLVDANIIGIFFWDFDGGILEANEAFLHMVGYNHDDLVAGRIRWTDLTPPEWRERDVRLIQEHRITGSLQPFEKEYFRKDGSRVPVLMGVASFEEGRNQGVAFVLDLTERKRAEQALRRSEGYLAEAQRLSHTSLAVFNKTTVLYWSDETYRMWEFDPLQGLPSREAVRQRMHPNDWERVEENIERGAREKRSVANEFRIILPDGRVKHVEATNYPVFSESGELLEIVGTGVDVTERKRKEERLRVQHRVAQILAEAVTIEDATPRMLQAMGECLGWDVGALWRVDRKAETLRCVELWHKASVEVPEFERVSRESTFCPGLGLPGRVWSSLEPEYVSDVVPDENFPRAPIAEREELHAGLAFPILLEGEALGVIEFFSREIRRPDQELLNVLATIGSQVGQFIERKRTEEALRESEQRARSALDGIAGLVAVLAPNGKLETVNRQLSEYFGRSLEWLKSWGTNDAVHPEDLPRILELVERGITTGIAFDFELRVRRFDGEYRWFENRHVPIQDDSGRIARWYVLLTDIEDRTRALARLEQMQSDFAHMNRVSMMGELAASLSHEITQPIAAARNYARAALNFLDRQTPDLHEVKKQLGGVMGAADRSGEIIQRIRDHIKKAPPRKACFDLNHAIDEIIAMGRSAISRNGVSVRTLLAEGLAPVRGDRVQLQQVVLNLILNAVEAIGSIELGPRDLLISTEQDQTQEVRVAVRDSGPGIDPENLERVFEAFYTTKTTGMGMGLSICRSIIDAHGGRLWASVIEPHGAVFQFTLPHAEKEIMDPCPAALHTRERYEDSASAALHPPACRDNQRPHRSGRVPDQRRSDRQ
jgi:PAS domain S-box-containing protein